MKTKFVIAALILGSPAATLVGLAPLHNGEVRAAEAAAPKSDQTARSRYRAECGACHVAYPARMLPPHAWKRIMQNLDRHYGDNAELSPALQAELTGYLLGHARKPRRYSEPAANELPRITTQRWFTHEHDELPRRMVQGNPKVGSFSNCAACHSAATQGHFSEHGVRIPGYGRWDD